MTPMRGRAVRVEELNSALLTLRKKDCGVTLIRHRVPIPWLFGPDPDYDHGIVAMLHHPSNEPSKVHGVLMKSLPWLLFCALAFALPLADAKVKYPKTAPCPTDGTTAKATGKTTPTLDPQCISVEYRHRWTDYTDHLHPQRMQHEFWLNVCADTTTANPTPSK